ncbi:hypothetical protein V6N00_08140 [Tersicoccus sp. MR15.9]|uniref:hypothetical protein n=1 Tax=Tersicoccus mangrovi TaxID=3121635 RepID=UPI002FE693BC
MTEQKPVLSEAELAAEDYHEKPRPGGPEEPLVPASEDSLDPESGTPVEGDATATVAAASGEGTAADTDVDPAGDDSTDDLTPGDDVVPGEDR